MSFIKELQSDIDKGVSPEVLAARHNISVENIRKVFLKWSKKIS